MNNQYEKGDIVYADAEPHSGHEIGGHDPKENNIRRPLVVVSKSEFNRISHLEICVPVTHTFYENRDGYLPFADYESGIRGSLIVVNPIIYDLNSRHAEVIGHLHDERLIETLTSCMKNCF